MFKGNVLQGFILCMQALPMLRQKGIKRYVVIPLLLNIMIFSALAVLLSHYAEQILGDLRGFLPGWLAWLTYVLVPLLIFMFLLGMFFLFNLIANLVAAPFNGLLAQAVSREQSPERVLYTESLLALVRRTLRREISKILYYLPRMLVLFIISWIPGLNLFAPFLWGAFIAWMVAVQYVDYAADNEGRSFAELRSLLASQPLSTLGFGGVIMAGLAVPLLNFIVIPLGVIAATLFWLQLNPPAGEKPVGLKALR